MLFFFKKSTVHIDAFTTNNNLVNYYPIEPARNFLPKWWKDLDKEYTVERSNKVEIKMSTIKRCSGFIDLYSKGFMMPIWSDLCVETKLTGDWRCVSPSPDDMLVSSHDIRQLDRNFNKFIHLKILSPWIFQEKSGINFHFTQPYWNHVIEHDRIQVVPGIINFKYQRSSNINAFVPKINHTHFLPAGTPIAHIIPITEKNVKIHFHCLTNEEMIKRFGHRRSKFTNDYAEKSKIVKNKEAKCPFRFFH